MHTRESLPATFLTHSNLGCKELGSKSVPLYKAIMTISDCNLLKHVIEQDIVIYSTSIVKLLDLAGIKECEMNTFNINFMQKNLGNRHLKIEHFIAKHMDHVDLKECLLCLERLHTWFDNRDDLVLRHAIGQYVIECYSRFRGIPPIPQCLDPIFSIQRSARSLSSFFYIHVYRNIKYSNETKKAIFLLFCRGKSLHSNTCTTSDCIKMESISRSRGKKATWHDLDIFDSAFTMMVHYEEYFRSTFDCNENDDKRYIKRQRVKEEQQKPQSFFTLLENYEMFTNWANINASSKKEPFCVKVLWRICTRNFDSHATTPPFLCIMKKIA